MRGCRDDIADVAHAREVHHQALEPKPEARVLAGAETAQIQVGAVLLGIHVQLGDAPLEHFQALLALGAAHDFSDARHEAVHGGHGAPVVVEPHVEGLDVLRVIDHERRAAEVLLGENRSMLGRSSMPHSTGLLEGAAGRGPHAGCRWPRCR